MERKPSCPHFLVGHRSMLRKWMMVQGWLQNPFQPRTIQYTQHLREQAASSEEDTWGPGWHESRSLVWKKSSGITRTRIHSVSLVSKWGSPAQFSLQATLVPDWVMSISPWPWFKSLGEGCGLAGANGPRIQKKRGLLVRSHPRNFLYRFVSLEMKSLERFLVPLPSKGKHPVSVPGTHPGNAPRTGPRFLPVMSVSSPASANFWPLLMLYKIIAVNFQNVWNVFVT